ncbi:tetratricopeptide repeat protein [Aequorivita sp. H23M31]|uniref:Tetratricopeptide repeat protein n=1 Tax=Aequorivita ciconiae TaxID=2494375 RepID=A0A410G3M1_9FLAO|nr:tetratricopeptide repeat protein [Aequorivita sp. H23M31]QAA81853.1 tetratricopeptide repeat protein [Aequorivita sp. H23M31]
MSIKQIIFIGTIFHVFLSCKEKSTSDFATLDDSKKEELSNYYHELSNYFLQPSELYRVYKDSALMVQPDNVEIRQKLSYSYKKVGDHIKAMEVLNKAVEIDTAQGKTDVLEYRAWTLLYYYRDYEGAVRDVDLIEKISGRTYNPCWGEPCGFHKGQALYKLREYEKAIETFEIVNIEEEKIGFDINDNYMIFFYMGRCYAEMKDFDNAIKYYKKSLASVDKFPEAYFQLGLVYKMLNKKAKADKNFELAKKYIAYNMGEPYVERFDKVFLYRIEREMNE